MPQDIPWITDITPEKNLEIWITTGDHSFQVFEDRLSGLSTVKF